MSQFNYSEEEMLVAFKNVLVLAEDQADQSKIYGIMCADDIISDKSITIMKEMYDMMVEEFDIS